MTEKKPLLDRLDFAHGFYCEQGSPTGIFEYDEQGNKTTIFGEAAAEIRRLNAERAGDQQRLFHYEGKV